MQNLNGFKLEWILMPGEFFSKILKEKDIHKKGTDLFIKLVKSLEIAYAKYIEAVQAWRYQDYNLGYTLRDEIIQMERDADKVKDVFFDSIFRKKAYLPTITEERHLMTINADHLLASIERAVRILCIKELSDSYFPQELEEIIKKTEKVLDLFVEANTYFFKDFEKSAKCCRKVEKLRDEVRDLYFVVLEKIVKDEVPRGTKRLLDATTRISILAEEAVDYLKVLITKHS